MDFERLERAWNGPANTPGEAASAYLTEELMAALAARRRSTTGFIGFVGLVLVLWTIRIAYQAVTDPFPFDISREWGLVPLFVLPWAGLFMIGAQQRRHEGRHPDPYASIPATLRALVDENNTEQRRLKITAGLMAACVLLLAIALRQLIIVGKMTSTNAWQAALLFVGLMAAVAAYKAWRYWRVLKPEALRLRRLLDTYAQD